MGGGRSTTSSTRPFGLAVFKTSHASPFFDLNRVRKLDSLGRSKTRWGREINGLAQTDQIDSCEDLAWISQV